MLSGVLEFNGMIKSPSIVLFCFALIGDPGFGHIEVHGKVNIAMLAISIVIFYYISLVNSSFYIIVIFSNFVTFLILYFFLYIYVTIIVFNIFYSFFSL